MSLLSGIRSGLRSGIRSGLNPSAGGGGTTTLEVAISDSADPVITAVNFNYSVVVTNSGVEDATNVTCTVVLDPQLTYVSSSGTGWATGHSAGTVTCTRATLAAGAAPTITITVTSPSAAETSSTTADADADNSDPAAQDTETTVCNLVTKDATSGIRIPQSSTEWTNFIAYHGLAAGVPSRLWLLQDASGNPAAAIGADSLTANNTPNYQQSETGWTAKSIGLDAGTADRIVLASGTGPDPATTSQMWFGLISFPAIPGATRVAFGINNNSATLGCHILHMTTSGFIQLRVLALTTDGTSNHSAGIHPVIVQYDRTNSLARVLSDLEIVTGTYSTLVVDGNKGLGSNSSANVKCLYMAQWQSAAAELSQANIKSLLQVLGWTIPW